MTSQGKYAALGALGGAVLAVAIVFGAAALGYLPGNGRIDAHALHAYLLAHPRVLLEMQNKLEAEEAAHEDLDEQARQAAVDKVGLKAFFDPNLAYVTGPADARTTLVEFFDYNCVHCRNTFPTIRKFYETHKDSVRFAFVEYPIFGKDSDAAARAAIAARRQRDKYVPFFFAMMEQKTAIDDEAMRAAAGQAGVDMAKLQSDMKDPAVDKTVAAAHALAARVHFDATPIFIVNGKVHSGELDADTLAQLTGARPD